MDDSQSSDIFPDYGDYSCESPVALMDTESYVTLVTNTKLALSKFAKKDASNQAFVVPYMVLLEDCATCIQKSLKLTENLLCPQNTSIELQKLQEYMSEAVCLLQSLSNFIKVVLESVSMSCSNMKQFPTTTGRIILTVFSHCKNSETLYGIHLKSVENLLKDLFRSCHDLQLTYLMILEKHFVFDLAAFDELAILVEALEINLKIGEVAQTLDVKTMAEQWKGFSMICEKYSAILMEKRIFQDCVHILGCMIEINLKAAVELGQEEKVVMRSLKVASFTIKILLKMCTIFTNATRKDYKYLIELLIFIYTNSSPYVSLQFEKSPQFLSQLISNISIPTDGLLKELLADEKFCYHLLNLDMSELKEEKLLGYMLLVVSVIKAVVGKGEEVISKPQLVQCVFRFLPYGSIWFNIGLKFKLEESASGQTVGLYEHLLIHTLALSCTLNNEDIGYLEKMMLESVIGLDCYCAIFASNLWSLLARLSSRSFVLAHVMFLCKTYQELKVNRLCAKSPQHTHLSFTLTQLFKALSDDDKLRFLKQFSIDEAKNYELWYCLKICNLPVDVQRKVETRIVEKLTLSSGTRNPEEMDSLISLLKLASTCPFLTNTEQLQLQVIDAWQKACPVGNNLITGELDRGDEWYLDYIAALSLLTLAMQKILAQEESNILKILHVATQLIEQGSIELKLQILSFVIHFSLELSDENRCLAETKLRKIVKHLMKNDDKLVRNKLQIEVHHKIRNGGITRSLHEVLSEEPTLRNILSNEKKKGPENIEDFRVRLESTMHLNYRHKCLESRIIEITSSGASMQKSGSNNFDFADIDTLFEVESDTEPACKKVRLNTDLEEIFTRLENDISLLCDVKENLSEHKTRLRNVSEKLISLCR